LVFAKSSCDARTTLRLFSQTEPLAFEPKATAEAMIRMIS
jgi:hypothetical protein